MYSPATASKAAGPRHLHTRAPQALLTPYPGSAPPPATAATAKKNEIASGQSTAEAAKARLVALRAGGLDSWDASAPSRQDDTPSWLREEPSNNDPSNQDVDARQQDAEATSMPQGSVDEPSSTAGVAPEAPGQDSIAAPASDTPAFLTESSAPAPENASATGGAAQSCPAADSGPSAERTIGYWMENQSQFAHLPPIPENWIRVKSKDESRTYFVCLTDGTTSFTMPRGSAPEREKAASAQVVSGSETRRLPPGWSERVSRSTGQKYYWNASTGISQFEVPAF